MPKIVRFHDLKGPNSLKIEERPSPELNEFEVRIKVHAVGLNRAEALFARGQYLETPRLASRIGYEAAGVVEEVGPNVSKAWLGHDVATIPSFSMSQYGVLGEEAIVPAHALGEYPPKLSYPQAATIWMQYLTAYGALIGIANLTRGDYVIIPAASSSVGIAAIEIARSEGAISIATTRQSSKKKELQSLGAHHVIATEEEDLVARAREITGGKGARVVFDPVAGPMLDKLAQVTAPGGIIFEYGSLSMQPTMFPLIEALRKNLTVRGWMLMELTSNPEKLEKAKKYIFERLEDGRFQPKIAKTFPFAQTTQAYEYLESNAQIGKVVITVP